MSTQKLSGDVEVAGDLDVTGAITGASLDVTGDVAGATATITGEVSAGSVSSTGDISTDTTLNAAALVVSDGAFIPNVVLCGFFLKLYTKTLSSGAVSWDVAGDGFASVAGVISMRQGAGGGASLEWAVSGTTVTVADGSGSSTSNVTVIVLGSDE